MLKKSVAALAFRDMRLNSRFRHRIIGATARRQELGTAQIVGGLLRLRLEAEATTDGNDLLHVRPLHEAVVRPDPVESLRERLGRHALVVLHFGYILRDDREQDHLLVEGLGVPEVALEDQRRAVDVGRQEDRCSVHAWRLRPLHLLEEAIHRNRGLRQESA
jgi:hypothetical protein